MTTKRQAGTTGKPAQESISPVVPQGTLRQLRVSDIKPSPTNPRRLFDAGPLHELRESIRQHGVLVPITVYQLPGQSKFRILDGERRYRCCVELEAEGLSIRIPANVVEPPSKIAGILYMFSIHNFRESWELMPTALSLKIVMEELGETDSKRLSKLTGLSEPQIERCQKLLAFPQRFQDLSLDPDPKTRIPSNFWIEAYPVLTLCEQVLPDVVEELGRGGITDRLVEKYRAKRIKSVIHFRRILEAFEFHAEDRRQQKAVVDRLREYISDVDLETRAAFDGFVLAGRRVQGAVKACEEFTARLERARLEHILEREELMRALSSVKAYVEDLLQRLEGGDAPTAEGETEQDAREA